MSIIIDLESQGLVGDEDEDVHRASLEATSASEGADPLRIPTPSARFKIKLSSPPTSLAPLPIIIIEILFGGNQWKSSSEQLEGRTRWEAHREASSQIFL